MIKYFYRHWCTVQTSRLFVCVTEDSDFSLSILRYGVYLTKQNVNTVRTDISNFVGVKAAGA